jgi:hypothetical protein
MLTRLGFLLVLTLSLEGTCISPLLSTDVLRLSLLCTFFVGGRFEAFSSRLKRIQESRQFGIHRPYLGLKLGRMGDIESIWRG